MPFMYRPPVKSRYMYNKEYIMTTKPQVGVILMTYGSPATLDDIPAYIKRVYGGREASPEVITEFRRRYALIGGSPLIRITREQAAALAEELNAQHPEGPAFHVVAGGRFFPPLIPGGAAGDAARPPPITWGGLAPVSFPDVP